MANKSKLFNGCVNGLAVTSIVAACFSLHAASKILGAHDVDESFREAQIAWHAQMSGLTVDEYVLAIRR